jgi:hypothetical protein
MKPYNTLLRFALLIALVAMALPGAGAANAQTRSEAQIVFLHLRMKNDTLTLVKSALRPGLVKQRRLVEKSGGIYYEVISSSGKSLWQGVTGDPSQQRLEYEDPDHPGELKTKYVKLNEVEFTLRIPFNPEMSRLELYRMAPAAIAQGRPKVLRKLIGSIPISFSNIE